MKMYSVAVLATMLWSAAAAFSLFVSFNADRSGAIALEGQRLDVGQELAIFLTPSTPVTAPVRFFTDGTFTHGENTAPWDYRGTAAGGNAKEIAAGHKPLDLGAHNILVTFVSNGTPIEVNASFTIVATTTSTTVTTSTTEPPTTTSTTTVPTTSTTTVPTTSTTTVPTTASTTLTTASTESTSSTTTGSTTTGSTTTTNTESTTTSTGSTTTNTGSTTTSTASTLTSTTAPLITSTPAPPCTPILQTDPPLVPCVVCCPPASQATMRMTLTLGSENYNQFNCPAWVAQLAQELQVALSQINVCSCVRGSAILTVQVPTTASGQTQALGTQLANGQHPLGITSMTDPNGQTFPAPWSFPWWLLVLIIGIGVLLIIAVIVICWCICRNKRKPNDAALYTPLHESFAPLERVDADTVFHDSSALRVRLTTTIRSDPQDNILGGSTTSTVWVLPADWESKGDWCWCTIDDNSGYLPSSVLVRY